MQKIYTLHTHTQSITDKFNNIDIFQNVSDSFQMFV